MSVRNTPPVVRLLPGLLLVLAGLSPSSQPATQNIPSPEPLITAQAGELPILLVAPHGGTRRLPGVDDRTGNNIPRKRGAKTNFSFALDRRTDTLTLLVADAIERSTGKRPYLVVAHFSRRQIDANRPAEEAVESDEARRVYDEFHRQIAAFREDILRKHQRGLLIDLHGHGGDPDVIYRGTADGRTVRNLIDTFGSDSVLGEKGVLSGLEARGARVVPPSGSEDRENPALNGGYIVRTYGSFAGGSFDAIQLELGAAFRSADRLEAFAGDLAGALVETYRRYLVRQEDGHAVPATSPAETGAPAQESPGHGQR